MTHRTHTSLLTRATTALTTAALIAPGAVFANTGGPNMPWDSAVANLLGNLSGPLARAMILMAIVITGVMWSFTEHGTGTRKLSQVVFGGAIALGAVSFLGSLGFTAALV